MYLVTVGEMYVESVTKYEFPSLVEANNFLFEEGFAYDSYDEDDDVHCWSYDQFTFGLVEKIQQ